MAQGRAFLILTSYYVSFIPGYSPKAALFSEVLRRKKKEKLKPLKSGGRKPRKAIQELKRAITHPPVPATLDPIEEFVLRKDTSRRALGGRTSPGARGTSTPSSLSKQEHVVERDMALDG